MAQRFQSLARLVLKRLLGDGEIAQEYIDQIERLNTACGEWRQLHPNTNAVLQTPDLSSPELVVVTGNLDLADQAGFCMNDEARELIRWIDDRTGHTATLLMLQVILGIQQAIRASKDQTNAN